jgi:hypothetical protein
MLFMNQEVSDILNQDGTDAIKKLLQKAVELEHSTIPPYLYALYSLDPDKNGVIAEIIHSVVFEEMLHMTLACNILNALGGAPVIDAPGFIPKYPGPLPGTVEKGLIVPLAPFSINLIHKAFMTIEEPEDPLNFPVAFAAKEPPLTIGQFYMQIAEKIKPLPQSAFPNPPRNQVGPKYMDESIEVVGVDTALQAINTIVEQGEGTKTSPLEVVGDDYAHYYRFAEVYHGKKLIKNPKAGPDTPPDQQYIYGGDAVPFDRTGVYAAPANPKTAKYPAGSDARQACITFNYSYTSLLKVLHTVFNGQQGQFGDAIKMMMSLRQQAIDMMGGKTTGGVSAGPSFEYQPVNR